MATQKVRSKAPPATTSASESARNPIPDSAPSPINYDDLPMPEGIEMLFDSEPPTDFAPDHSLDEGAFFDREMAESRTDLESVGEPKPPSPLTLAARTALRVAEASALERPVSLQEKYLLVILAGERYAIPLLHVLQVGEITHFTSVPNVPEWVIGVTNLRGDIVSIIDIRAMLNLEADEYEPAENFMLTQTLESDITACLLVERMLGIVNIEHDEIQNANTVISDRLAPFVSGLYAHEDGILSVLNIESLLRSLDISLYRS